jgi:N-acetylneuraminic acid mutarotase
MPMPEARLGGAAVSLGDYLYVIGGVGGSSNLLRYEPVQDRWESLAALSQPREHTAAVAYAGKIYAIGGRWQGVGELASVEIYDPENDAWSAGPELTVARAGHSAAVLGDRIVALGGEVLSGGRQALDSVEVLAPGGEWVPGPSLPVGLHGVPAVGFAGRLYVLGGSDRAGGIENVGRVLSRVIKP